MIQTSVAFTPEMHRRLTLAALDERAAIVEIIREAVAAYLTKRDVKRKGKGRA